MAYVYEHWRPDINSCFYVGKGNSKRAYLLWGVVRNEHHRRIVEKLRRNGLKVEVKIVADSLSDEDAFKMEQERIAFYGIENLTNQTAGGDGLKSPTLVTRQKMIDARKRTLADPDFRFRHAEGIRLAMERDPLRSQRIGAKRRGTKHSAETIAKVSAALKGRKRPELSKRMTGDRNPFFGKKHADDVLARIAEKKRGSKMSPETRIKMQAAQRQRRESEARVKPPPQPFVGPPKPRYTHPPEICARISAARKAAGMPRHVIEAATRAKTGKKRAPFKESTILKMRVAAAERERKKQATRVATASENQLRLIA